MILDGRKPPNAVLKLTEEELLIGALRHLDTFHRPIIEDYSSDEWWALKVVATQASPSP